MSTENLTFEQIQALQDERDRIALRDEFAKAALTGICSQRERYTANEIANYAYSFADAMMHRRSLVEERV